MKRKKTYEQVIDFLETHNGKMMRGIIYKNGKLLKRNELPKELKEETTLYYRWYNSPEFKMLKQYAGQPIENVPEEYREIIEKLRSYGLERKQKGPNYVYEQVIDFLETHNGILMKCNFYNNGIRLKKEELTQEQQDEIKLCARWKYSNEYKILEKYAGQPIEEVPEEYREKIEKLRSYGLGLKKRRTKTTYEEVIDFLETHNGKLMKRSFYESGNPRPLRKNKLTEEQLKEANLAYRWAYSKEYKILEKYAGKPIEEVPEEYRDKIEKLRSYGLGMKEKSTKTTYEQVIEHLETHDGKIMKGTFYKNKIRFKNAELTPEQIEEKKLYIRWINSEECKILKEYAGQPIENVPEEYREKIEKLRSYNLDKKEKESKYIYEQVIDFLETHNGKMMRGIIHKNGVALKRKELTPKQKKETILYYRWYKSPIFKILKKYEGQPIENVPEEYREKIEKLRSYGLGMKEKGKKTTYEQVIEYLETHNGKMMRGTIYKNGAELKREEMTPEEREELNLYFKWYKSPEFKKLKGYAGQPIENVPEEYREKIEKLRSYGFGLEKNKISKAKQERDKAKNINDKARELENNVSDKLKKVSDKFKKEDGR